MLVILLMDSVDIFEPPSNQLPSRMSFSNTDEDNYKNMQNSRIKVIQKDSIIDLLYEYKGNSYSQFSPNSKKSANQHQSRYKRSPSIQFIVAEDLHQTQYPAEDSVHQNFKIQKNVCHQPEQHCRALNFFEINKSENVQQNENDKSNDICKAFQEIPYACGQHVKNKISTTYTSSIEEISYSQTRPDQKLPFMCKKQRVKSNLKGQVLPYHSQTQDNNVKESCYQVQIQKASQNVALIKQQNQKLQQVLTYIKTIVNNKDSIKPSLLLSANNNNVDPMKLKNIVEKYIRKR